MCSMLIKAMLLLFFFLDLTTSTNDGFTLNGLSNANLSIDGFASIMSNGLLELTNTTKNAMSHAFHPTPLRFKSAAAGKIVSFSTTCVFAILGEGPILHGASLAFVVSPTTDFSSAFLGQYVGLFNSTNNGNSTNHIFAVQLDTKVDNNPSLKVQETNSNNLRIDLNGIGSIKSRAGYYEDGTSLFHNLTIVSGQPMQLWIDFNAASMQLNVTLSLVPMKKPSRPLVSSTINLSRLLLESMYVGFSASNGFYHTRHYVLGWSFKMNGEAEPLDYTKLPSLPLAKTEKHKVKVLAIWLPLTLFTLLLLIHAAGFLIVRRRMKYAELLEDWEEEYGPHRFSYKELYKSTKGFREKELLGTGGFGRVYKGVLPSSKLEVAVKKVSHESMQGVREFVAEIVNMGQLRHRNLVQLLGYCRRKKELLLVYDFMPNGSLDKFLYDHTKPTLNWAERFLIIKGVASGVLYLHEDSEKVVVHRDIKASNVLLDSELNGRLGDFGLSRLYDHGADPETTRVVGTMGYLAPELALTSQATTRTDVYAIGIFVLEVVCGRRPIVKDEETVLADWVFENWQRETLMDTMDPRLTGDCCVYEVELVLKLGLLCLHPAPAARPSMRQVVRILDGNAEITDEMLPNSLNFNTGLQQSIAGFDEHVMSCFSSASTVSNMLLSGGR